MKSPNEWTTLQGLSYGLLGFPLAFCALPLYVMLPNLYAREFGVPLAALGAVLLGARHPVVCRGGQGLRYPRIFVR